MKKLFLLSTRPWIYLSTLPFIALLIPTLIYNGESEGVWKLYPLIITLIFAICFILVYFFGAVFISTDEVEKFAVFGDRDSAILDKGKTLIIGRISKTRIKVCVFGNDGIPDIDYVKNDSTYEPIDIFLLRAKAVGTRATLVRIMEYFDIPKGDAEALTEDADSYEDEFLSVKALSDEFGRREIRITFKKTL